MKICIEESLTLQKNRSSNRIDFSDDIMNNKLRHIGEQHLRFNMNKCKNKGAFGMLSDISEDIALGQLLDTSGNMSPAINILGY